MPPSILALSGVLKRYGETLGVGPVDFDLRQGEFLTLLGPSGCGKTTTLHIVAGLLLPDAGSVSLANRDITRLEPQHRDMGVVFQNYALFPHKSIFDNVAFGLRMRGVPRPQVRTRVGAMLELVGLPGVEARFPHQLSGGQRQRVALARALVIEPTLLLLDEPLSNLDAVLRKRMRLELREIQRRLGIATLFVTHDQDEAFEMSDRVVLMNAGHIEQVGTPEELYDQPASRFAAEFIGEANLIDGVAAAGLAPGLGAGTYLMVRPERVEMAPVRPASGPAVSAKVAKRVFAGDLIRFTLRTENGATLTAAKPSTTPWRALAADTTVWITLADFRVVPKEAGG